MLFNAENAEAFDEGIAETQRAIQLELSSTILNSQLAPALHFAGRAFTVASLPIGIRTIRKKPFHRFARFRSSDFVARGLAV